MIVYIKGQGFLQKSKNMHIRVISDFELPIGVNVSMCSCLSLYASPVSFMECQMG